MLFSLNDIDKKKAPVQEEVIGGHLKDGCCKSPKQDLKVVSKTRFFHFQKRVMCTKFDIYVFIKTACMSTIKTPNIS